MARLFRPSCPRFTRSPRLTAGALLLVSVAGCGLTTRVAGPTNASPAAASGSPTSPLTPSASASPDPSQTDPCRAANLTADPVTNFPLGMTQIAYRVRLVNHGPACTLRGYPQHLTGLALTGTVREVHPRLASGDEASYLTSGTPANLATGDAAEFALHAAYGCDVNRVGPLKSESYTRLWFTLPDQSQRITVIPQVTGPGPRREPIGLPRCFIAMTRFYAALPTAAPNASPTPTEPTPSADPTGILDDPEAPTAPSGFISGNRWHGYVGGQDVNVWAGSAGVTHMDTGKVIVELGQPGSPGSQTLNLLSPHSGPLMIVAAPYPARLTLWDSHGYRHTLILARPKPLEYEERGPRVAIPAVSTSSAAPCDHDLHHLVIVAAGPDTPYPRCVAVFADQALQVQNHTGLAGQSPHPITVGFASLPTTTLQPRESVVFPHPFTGLAPGVHRLHLGYLNEDIWVR